MAASVRPSATTGTGLRVSWSVCCVDMSDATADARSHTECGSDDVSAGWLQVLQSVWLRTVTCGWAQSAGPRRLNVCVWHSAIEVQIFQWLQRKQYLVHVQLTSYQALQQTLNNGLLCDFLDSFMIIIASFMYHKLLLHVSPMSPTSEIINVSDCMYHTLLLLQKSKQEKQSDSAVS